MIPAFQSVHGHWHRKKAFELLRGGAAFAIVAQHKQPNGRRKPAIRAARLVDFCGKRIDWLPTFIGNVTKRLPEFLLKRDRSAVSAKGQRPFFGPRVQIDIPRLPDGSGHALYKTSGQRRFNRQLSLKLHLWQKAQPDTRVRKLNTA